MQFRTSTALILQRETNPPIPPSYQYPSWRYQILSFDCEVSLNLFHRLKRRTIHININSRHSCTFPARHGVALESIVRYTTARFNPAADPTVAHRTNTTATPVLLPKCTVGRILRLYEAGYISSVIIISLSIISSASHNPISLASGISNFFSYTCNAPPRVGHYADGCICYRYRAPEELQAEKAYVVGCLSATGLDCRGSATKCSIEYCMAWIDCCNGYCRPSWFGLALGGKCN